MTALLLDIAGPLGVFVLTVAGLASPWVRTAGLTALERLCLGLGGALIAIYLGSFALYLGGLNRGWHWLLPVAAIALLVRHARDTAAFVAQPEVRRAITLWGLLAAWCLGLTALIVNYSGGGWAADLWEHHDRARFFLERWPLGHSFQGYALPARPPFANLVTGAFLGLTGPSFAHFQVIATLLSTLAFLPALQWLRLAGGQARHETLLLGLFMASPLFVENATLPVTKMPTAFFVLAGAALVFRRTCGDAPRAAGHAGWALLAAGLLCHYSAGPWIVAVTLGVAVTRRDELPRAVFWREHAVSGLVAATLGATWLGWAAHTYGWAATLGSNTTVIDAAGRSFGAHLRVVLDNILHTLVPHFLRPPPSSAGWAEGHALATVRDFFFNLYQLNLPFIAGSAGGALALWLLWREPVANARVRTWWCTLLPAAVLLGIAVHSGRSEWGLAHICLQPLALLALAWLAVRAPGLPAPWRVIFAVAAVVDFLLGVALHFGLQALALDRWVWPGYAPSAYAFAQGAASPINYAAKLHLKVTFLGDIARPHATLIVAALVLIALGVVWHTWRGLRHPAVSPSTPSAGAGQISAR